MKIILADDELLARVYLQSTLSEVDDSIEVVGEAKNGEELLVLLKQHLPDAVYVDIRMPKMDGLSAIRLGKEISPHTQWVVLSGFSEFQYAQEALELGACHYFLKPVRPSELHQSIQHIKEKALRSLNTLNNEFENTVLSLLHRCSRVTDLQPDSPVLSCRMTGYLLFLDGTAAQTVESGAHSELVTEVRKAAMDHLFNRDGRFSLTTLSGGEIAVIHAANTSSPPLSISRFERSLIELIQRFFQQSRLSVTPFRTGYCNGVEHLLRELDELQSLGAMRAVLPFGSCLRLEEMKNLHETTKHQLLAIGRRLEKIAEHFHTGDYLHYSKEVALLSKDLRGQSHHASNKLQHLQHFIERSIGLAAHDVRLEQWIRKLTLHGEHHLLQSADPGQDSRDLVQIVIDYVDNHYMHDIGIGQIAQEIGVTYNYLSTIFHKKCGITFMNYLTKTRMLKAKQLLMSHPHMKIQNVATEVGYYSTRYFTKAFTKQFNCYPSEIRSSTQQDRRIE